MKALLNLDLTMTLGFSLGAVACRSVNGHETSFEFKPISFHLGLLKLGLE